MLRLLDSDIANTLSQTSAVTGKAVYINGIHNNKNNRVLTVNSRLYWPRQ